MIKSFTLDERQKQYSSIYVNINPNSPNSYSVNKLVIYSSKKLSGSICCNILDEHVKKSFTENDFVADVEFNWKYETNISLTNTLNNIVIKTERLANGDTFEITSAIDSRCCLQTDNMSVNDNIKLDVHLTQI